MANDNTPQNNEIILYSSPEGDIKIEVFFNDESFWLSQKKMAELFGVDVRTVNEHLQNIYNTSELQKEATIRKIRIVQKEGSRDVDLWRKCSANCGSLVPTRSTGLCSCRWPCGRAITNNQKN